MGPQRKCRREDGWFDDRGVMGGQVYYMMKKKCIFSSSFLLYVLTHDLGFHEWGRWGGGGPVCSFACFPHPPSRGNVVTKPVRWWKRECKNQILFFRVTPFSFRTDPIHHRVHRGVGEEVLSRTGKERERREKGKKRLAYESWGKLERQASSWRSSWTF
uniref:Uncharacterized protein n=1 Tax=Palpitomonas bilix TaxID=652834 RepID=A0A7S3DLB8_9EUKA